VRKLARLLLNKLKNEPVMLLAFLAIAGQALQKAIDGGHFTFTLWMTYLFQMVMASIARELVVPGTAHDEAMKRLKEINSNLASSFVKGGGKVD